MIILGHAFKKGQKERLIPLQCLKFKYVMKSKRRTYLCCCDKFSSHYFKIADLNSINLSGFKS